jgi:dihydroneopterin aldolase
MKYGIIGFDHYKIGCIIGVNHEERITPQDIYVDLRVEHDFSIPAKHDDFEKTFCYEMLGKICEELAIKKKYRLLETMAFELIEILLNQYKIKWAFVRIKKPSAILMADYAVVEFEGGKRS